jgi:hypothetical protein
MANILVFVKIRGIVLISNFEREMSRDQRVNFLDE